MWKITGGVSPEIITGGVSPEIIGQLLVSSQNRHYWQSLLLWSSVIVEPPINTLTHLSSAWGSQPRGLFYDMSIASSKASSQCSLFQFPVSYLFLKGHPVTAYIFFLVSPSLQTFLQLLVLEGNYCRPGSSVGIATGYGLDGPGIESRWERDFPHLSRPALGLTQLPVQWIPSLSLG